MKKVLSILLSVFLIAGCIIPTMLVSAEEGALKPYYQNGNLYYEATAGFASNGATTVYSDWADYTIDGCSDNSCVILQGGSVSLDIDVPYSGYYNIGVSGSTYNANDDTHCSVWINGSEYYYRANHEDFCKWPVVGVSTYDYGTNSFLPCGGLWLNAGRNTVSLKYNNGWMYVDRLAISVASVNIPDEDPIAIVNNAIENLPKVLNNDNYRDVARVKESYDALNDFQKSLIKGENYTKLLEKVEEAKAFELIGHEVFNDDGYSYQAESAILDNATVENYIEATGNKFIDIKNGTATFKFKVPYDGYYKVNFAVSTYNDTTDTSAKVKVGNSENEYYVTANHENNGSWKLSCLNSYNYDESKYVPVEGGFYFSSTEENTIVLSSLDDAWMLFDRMVLVPDSLTYPENDPAGLVFNTIQSLPEELSIENKATVQAAKSGFDDLDATGRVAVINVEKLNTAFENMINLNVINSSEVDGSYVYEAENAMYTDRAFVVDDANASSEKYINIAYGTLYMNINVPTAGKYDLKIFGSTNDENTSKCDYVSVNGKDIGLVAYPKTSFGSWTECEPGAENWVDGEIKPIPAESIELNEGENLVVIRANWGKTNYDKLVLVPATVEGDVDGNGVLEAVDMSALIKHILGVDTAVAPDVNNDGKVNIVDVVALKKILISL